MELGCREVEGCPLDKPCVFEEIHLILIQVSFINEELMVCVDLFIHDQAPRISCGSLVFLCHPSIFCAAIGGTFSI